MTFVQPEDEGNRVRHKFWGTTPPPGIKHGNGTAAKSKYGCDCTLCLPSGRRNRPRGQGKTPQERNRDLRERKRGHSVPPGTKHGRYAYRTYGCRCAVCEAANAAQRPNQVWKRRAWGVWTEGPKTTTLCWPPQNAGPEWTCDCGRTREAS